MCGGGGGGAGSPAGTPAGKGGSGGITIYEKIPLSGVTNITYNVGTGGAGGLGHRSRPLSGAVPGSSGNATTVVISSTTYTANGGVFGQTTLGQPTYNGADGTIDPPNPTTYPAVSLNTATNVPLTYQSTTTRNININFTNYCQGGIGGNANGTNGNAGQAGRPGYLRIYLYP